MLSRACHSCDNPNPNNGTSLADNPNPNPNPTPNNGTSLGDDPSSTTSPDVDPTTSIDHRRFGTGAQLALVRLPQESRSGHP